MDRFLASVCSAVLAILVVLALFGVFVASSYTSAWQRDCDNLGAVMVDGVAYECHRKPKQASET